MTSPSSNATIGPCCTKRRVLWLIQTGVGITCTTPLPRLPRHCGQRQRPGLFHLRGLYGRFCAHSPGEMAVVQLKKNTVANRPKNSKVKDYCIQYIDMKDVWSESKQVYMPPNISTSLLHVGRRVIVHNELDLRVWPHIGKFSLTTHIIAACHGAPSIFDVQTSLSHIGCNQNLAGYISHHKWVSNFSWDLARCVLFYFSSSVFQITLSNRTPEFMMLFSSNLGFPLLKGMESMISLVLIHISSAKSNGKQPTWSSIIKGNYQFP